MECEAIDAWLRRSRRPMIRKNMHSGSDPLGMQRLSLS